VNRFREGCTHLRVSFKIRQSLVNQVEPDMGGAIVNAIPRHGLASQSDSQARDFTLRMPAALGNSL
jgi:hypothetical protein